MPDNFRDVVRTVTTPTMMVDMGKCEANLDRILVRTRQSGVAFRPHFKTHQSRQIGSLFREKGIGQITVSSVGMAEYFAGDGWDDICIAFPVNLREFGAIRSLADRCILHLIVEDQSVVDELSRQIQTPVSVWIKVDVGSERTGIPWQDHLKAVEILKRIKTCPNLTAMGYLTHAGHSYQCRTKESLVALYEEQARKLINLREATEDDHNRLALSVGDTPTLSVMETYNNVDEVRPGNFIFYDLMQLQIGCCTTEDIAVAMACPVVAVHRDRSEMVLYGGAVHFSKDYFSDHTGVSFGLVTGYDNSGWHPKVVHGTLVRLSQEHGIVRLLPEALDLYRPGDIAMVLPVHSCLTAECMGVYLSTTGVTIDHYRGRRRTC